MRVRAMFHSSLPLRPVRCFSTNVASRAFCLLSIAISIALMLRHSASVRMMRSSIAALPEDAAPKRVGFVGYRDFGDRVHDAQFCINGLTFPDRTPHPAMEEVRTAPPLRAGASSPTTDPRWSSATAAS